MTQIDLTQMTLTELEQHVDRLYGVCGSSCGWAGRPPGSSPCSSA
jgi:hypothetical protein